jgi:hypothetical protein
MAVSDLFLGGYLPGVMAVVYACLTLPVLCGGTLRQWFPLRRAGMLTWLARGCGWGMTAVGCSCLFFIASNFAWWTASQMYTHDAAGLLACYTQALPFFRYTLTGDLTFAAILFGGAAIAVECGWVGMTKTAPAAE